MLSAAFAGGLLILAGGVGPSATQGAVTAPLIVTTAGDDISSQRPMPAAPDDGSKAVASGNGEISKPETQAGSGSRSGPSRAGAVHVRLHEPRSALDAYHAYVSDQHPFAIPVEGAQKTGWSHTAVTPDRLDVQAIVNGSSKSALVDGKLYRVGDRIGPSQIEWTVSAINESSVTMKRQQNNRVFAVTVYTPGGAPSPIATPGAPSAKLLHGSAGASIPAAQTNGRMMRR